MDKLASNYTIFPATLSTLKQIEMACWIQPLRCSRSTLRQLFKVNKMPRSPSKREKPVLHSCVTPKAGKLWELQQTYQSHSDQQRPSRNRQLSAPISMSSCAMHGSRCLLQEFGHRDGVQPSRSCCKSIHCF